MGEEIKCDGTKKKGGWVGGDGEKSPRTKRHLEKIKERRKKNE